MDKKAILDKLPPFDGNYKLIAWEQSVGDIIREVLDSHTEFSGDYNQIALCFDGDTLDDICNNIFNFCKKNFYYDEQTELCQMSMSPAAMIELRNVDCKNYAGFCGGILGGLNRLTSRKISWCYRFASYDMFDTTPHHVFVVVNPGGNEIWFDPTPGAHKKKPYWQLDKKVKQMPLYRVSGLPHAGANGARVGIASITVTPAADGSNNLNFDGTNKFAGVFNPYLGLSNYRDYDGDRNINESSVADQINKLIAAGPDPGHTVDAAFVKWIYNTSNRAWNFYYEGGVLPGFDSDNLLPGGYPKPVMTDDGRLALDNPTPIDDYRNPYVHLLQASLQNFINTYSPSPYPLTPQLVKEFSQKDPTNGNLLNQPRGSSVFADIGDFLKKYGLSAPRNAYLSLVGINAFGYATKLFHAIYNDDGSIDANGYYALKEKWESLGGDFSKFENTIRHGAQQKAILGVVNGRIGAAPAVAAWAVTAVAIIAAITPLVKSLLDKKKMATGFDYNLDPTSGMPYPESPGSGGFDPLTWIKQHPIESAAIGIGGYFLLSKKKSTVTGINQNYLFLLLLGVGYLLLKQKNNPQSAAQLPAPTDSIVEVGEMVEIPVPGKPLPLNGSDDLAIHYVK